MNRDFWKGKRVLITGHTGFKGSWLSMWLRRLGAEVFGIALDPPTDPSMYEIADIIHAISLNNDYRCNLRIFSDSEIVYHIDADIIFHLAAQPIVLRSYEYPVETFETNIMSTVHLLEAARSTTAKAIVVITTDKVYEDQDIYPYRETDRLGGHDPYSASKACVELIVESYRRSFFFKTDTRIATARAGNVIGGGDFGEHRLVPDIVRAWLKNETLQIRNPNAVRPWQHVLDPLAGYMALAERLCSPEGKDFEGGWNFGPSSKDILTVGRLVDMITGATANIETEIVNNPAKETDCLLLDSTKSRRLLNWRPRYDVLKAISETAVWYKVWQNGGDMRAFTNNQIAEYEEML